MTKLKKSGATLIREYQEKVTALKTDLIGKISDLPDNPKIKRIGTEGKAFTMSSKDLGESWSPFYYDFKSQYKAIVKIINTSPIETVITKMESIVENGYADNSKSSQRFHPEVRKYLSEMM
jgi:hypothetical protein